MSRLTKFLRERRWRRAPARPAASASSAPPGPLPPAPLPPTAGELLPVFLPSSTNSDRWTLFTYQAANRFPDLAFSLAEDVGLTGQVREVDARTFMGVDAESALPFGELLARHGSDKRNHEYHFVYARILDLLGLGAPLNVLEIGLGTTDPEAISTMGPSGKPGASLRAFRDYLPQAQVFGADIDRHILFREERITTAFADQTRPETLRDMHAAFGRPAFDLVIDDGLHSVEANLNTLRFTLGVLRPEGWIVIEDIPHRTVVAWRLVATILTNAGFPCCLVTARTAHLFIVRPRPAPTAPAIS